MRSVGIRHAPVTHVAVAVALALQGAAAWADLNDVASFNIPAQPLSTALIQFSNQADVQVVSNADQLANLASAGLSGKHSGREALQLLLREHALQFDEITARSVRIVPGKPTATTSSAAAASDEIEEVVVQSTLLFVQNDAFGATKMGLSIVDTPQTVTVITEDMMELMNVNTLDDINRIMPGSSRTFDFVGNQNFYFRGFQVDLDTGLRIDGFRFDSENQLNPALFERIEVIQGATSTMYGQNSPAGTVNAVSKIPQPDFKAEVGLEGGSNEYYDVDGDVTGALFGSDAWSYRLIGNYQSYGTHWDQVEDDRWIVSPSVRYSDENTNFIARVVYQEREATQFRSSYLQFDRPVTALTPAQALAAGAEIIELQVPNSRFLGMPWGFQNEDILTAQTQIDHTFDNRWTVRGNLQYSREGRDTSLYAVGGPFSYEGRPAYEYVQDLYSTSKSYSGEVNLYGPFQAFGREHTAFIGIDYGAQNTDPAVNLLAYTAATYTTTRFNAFTPDYGLTTLAQAEAFMATQPLNYSETNDKYLGITAQVLLKPIDRLTLSLGGRYSYDTVKTRTGRAVGLNAAKTAFAGTDATLNDFDDFVHQLGATFELAEDMNLYAAYGQGFSPVTSRRWVPNDPSGELIGAELSRNYEVGFKADFKAGWGVRFALFDTRRTNISQADPDPSHTCGAGACALPIGEQIAQGVEGVVQGRITPSINAFLAASYLDTSFKGDLKGIRPNNTPRFSTSAFASYEFLDSKLLRGLGVSVGVTYKTDLVAPDTTLRRNGVVYVYEVGDITEVDARVFYNWQNMNFYVLAQNVLDEQYVAASNLNFGLNLHTNPGREYRAGVKWKF